MDTVITVFGNMLQDSNTMVMGLLVFLAAGTLAFSVMAADSRSWLGQAAHRAHPDRRRAQGQSFAFAAAFQPEDGRQV